jgi:AhpD family alkylhydroperoxidase
MILRKMKTKKSNLNSDLELHLIELVRLRIGYLNECNYSINLHYEELKNLGESDVRLLLVSVWNKTPYFSEKERAIFTLTDYIINDSDKNSFEEVRKFLTSHFNKEQIARLIQAIKQIDLWTRSMKHLDTTSISIKKSSC